MLRAISLFTGVGGLDFGFEAAGFETAVAVEIDAVSCRTLRVNRDWPVIERDIHKVTSDELLRTAMLRQGEADVLIGGPPCQPFSKSGYWARGDALRLDDPRADTLTAYLRVLRDAQPKAFLLENVYGPRLQGQERRARPHPRRHRSDQSCDRRELSPGLAGGRRCELRRAAASRTRVRRSEPRRQGRLSSRSGRTATRSICSSAPTSSLYRTAWDALGGLPRRPIDPALKMGGKWAALLPSIPEGENYLWHTPRGRGIPLFGWRTRYWSFLLKLAKARPSWTIQAQPGPATGRFHWTNRRLSAEELCRLQAFPRGLQFDCGRNDVQRMLGNAVPSLVAEIIAHASPGTCSGLGFTASE